MTRELAPLADLEEIVPRLQKIAGVLFGSVNQDIKNVPVLSRKIFETKGRQANSMDQRNCFHYFTTLHILKNHVSNSKKLVFSNKFLFRILAGVNHPYTCVLMIFQEKRRNSVGAGLITS